MLNPADFSVIETLRNGRKIEIRAQRPQNRKDLEAAIVRMSDESLYRSFFVAARPRPSRSMSSEPEDLSLDRLGTSASRAGVVPPG